MNELSHSSYKEYLIDALSQTSSMFSIKSYKRANLEEWIAFKKGVDIIVKIFWDKTVIYEFVIEKSFWNQRNTNTQDRKYMRRYADQKIQMFKNCVTRKKSDGV
jgi:hypothetical protein